MPEDATPQGGNRARDVVRHTSTTSVAAALGVASGLLLDVAIAAGFGAGSATDSFFVAARIPLGIDAVMMVAANQVLVPTFSTWLVHVHEREAWRRVTTLALGTLLLGVAFAIVAALVSGPLIRLTAPGLSAGSTATATELSRILFLIVPLIGLTEVLRAVLNARHSFAAPALMNVVLNAVAAGIIILFGHGAIQVVAWAIVAGYFAQLVFLAGAALVHGFRPVRGGSLRDPAIIGTARLSVRPIVGASLNPLARVGEQMMISFLPAGSISIMGYGYRLISAIGGSVLFRSVIAVILPRLTAATAKGEESEIRRLTRLGVTLMLAVSVPLAAMTAVLGRPAVLAIFERGNFSAEDATLLGTVLAVYALSLVGSGVQRSLLAPFYARLNTRVPLRNTAYGVAVNLALVPVFVLPFGKEPAAVVGVAAAYSAAQYVNVLHARHHLRHDLSISLRGVGAMTLRILAAGVVMTIAMVAAVGVLDPEAAGHRWGILLRTAIAGLAGLAALAAVVPALGLLDLRRTVRSMRRSADPPGTGSGGQAEPSSQ